jgi:hypothetical protein
MNPNVTPGAPFNGDALEQLVFLNEGAPKFRQEIDRLCRLAAGEDKGGYSRSTRELNGYTWTELKGLRARHKHADRYMTGCETVAYECFRVTLLPARVHWLVCARMAGEDTYRLDISGIPRARPAWEGGVASNVAAHLTGNATFGSGATAQREAFQRQGRPLAAEYQAAAASMLVIRHRGEAPDPSPQ